MRQPDPATPNGAASEGETLARFAVLLAAQRGQIAGLSDKVDQLAADVTALTAASPKGPPMIAWHDLDPDEAAAVRADLAQWVRRDPVPHLPQRHRQHPGLLASPPRRGHRTVRGLAGVPPHLHPGAPGRARQAGAAPPGSPRRHPDLPRPVATRSTPPHQAGHRELHRDRRAHRPARLTRPRAGPRQELPRQGVPFAFHLTERCGRRAGPPRRPGRGARPSPGQTTTNQRGRPQPAQQWQRGQRGPARRHGPRRG